MRRGRAFFTSRILPLRLLRALSLMSAFAEWRRDMPHGAHLTPYYTRFAVGVAMRVRGSAILSAQMTVTHFDAIG